MPKNITINRRKVLKTAPIIALTTAGCTGGQEEATPTPTPTPQQTQPPASTPTPEQTPEQSTPTETPSYEEAVAALKERAEEEGELFLRTTVRGGNDAALLPLVEREADISTQQGNGSTFKHIAQSVTEMQVGKLQADTLTTTKPIERAVAMEEDAMQGDNYPPAVTYGQASEEFKLSWDNDNIWMADGAFSRGLLFNTEIVSEDEIPTTFDEMLDPQWEESFIINTEHVAILHRVMREKGSWEAAVSWLEEFVPNILRFTTSSFTATNDVAEGRAPMFINGPTSLATEFSAEFPVQLNFTNNTTMLIKEALGIFREAPHPNAAKFLFEIMTTQEAQTKIQDEEFAYSLEPSLWPEKLKQVQETGEVWVNNVPFVLEVQRQSGLNADGQIDVFQETIGAST